MKRTFFSFAIGLSVTVMSLTGVASADDPAAAYKSKPLQPVAAAETGTTYVDDAYSAGASQYPPRKAVVRSAIHERNHPYPLYAYGRRGVDATNVHEWNQMQAGLSPWHGAYYNTQWGRPVALVVPPTSAYETHWSWGVAQTRVTPIYHQFGRNFPGPYPEGGPGFAPTPRWPSSTDQFGVYPVRGPW